MGKSSGHAAPGAIVFTAGGHQACTENSPGELLGYVATDVPINPWPHIRLHELAVWGRIESPRDVNRGNINKAMPAAPLSNEVGEFEQMVFRTALPAAGLLELRQLVL